MKSVSKFGLLFATAFCSFVALATPNYASLVVYQTYTGNVGQSTDGFGSTDGEGVISASAPTGATVIAAYLYSATQNSSAVPTDVTLNGVDVIFTDSFPNATACCSLSSHRADVTSIVAAQIDGGLGGIYDFAISEGLDNSAIDGSALVVVYNDPTALVESTIGILNGFASVTGDTTSITFADPLNPASPGFKAEMYLGINFSCGLASGCTDQRSTVMVNGDLLTENAGNFDDSEQFAANFAENGSLITVGGFDDPFQIGNPSYAADKEKYNLASFITPGDTSIIVDTFNTTEDDNIFLAVFHVSGEAVIGPPPIPLPAGIWLLGAGLAALGFGGARSRRKKAQQAA
jgi:hypothetical protein